MLDAAQYLADHIHEAPVWIVPCLEGATSTRTSGSSIYPAVQNMLLAARALGLGATLTTLYLNFERRWKPRLGCRRTCTRMRSCLSVIRWAVSGRFVVAPPGRLFGRQHIAPEQMVPMLSRMWLADVHRDPLRFRYRLYGTALVSSLHREVTGQWLDEAQPETVFNSLC
jgi:hypothetical protein